jgi:Hint domain
LIRYSFGNVIYGVIVMPDPSVLSVSNPINYIDDYSVNPIGRGTPIGDTGYYSGGTYDSVGAGSVTPVAGTTVTATQGSATYNISYLGGAAFPNQFFENVPYNPALTGSWTLTVVNASESNSGLTVTTPTLDVTTTPPLVTGINISGNGAAPTISWSIPAGSPATSQTVYIYKINPTGSSTGATYASVNLSAGTTEYTVPTGVFTPGSLYSISVQSDVYSRGGASGNLEARSRQYTSPFTASTTTITTPVFLPVISPALSAYGGPIYDFDVNVTAGAPIVIDPAIATGFIYQTGTSDPNFASVTLPDVGNPTPYDLYTWNGSSFVFDTTLNPDTTFDFAAGGVGKFEVLGIDPSVGLNALDATDFATQLTFTDPGSFTGTMTPLCFLPGTLIATPSGETPIERLTVGDPVMNVRGETRRILWIGVGHVLAGRGRRNVATPVIVRKGALADNVPHKDLRVTKAHSLYLDSVLVPAEFLVNHRSILWDDHAQELSLYHIELETHDVLLANGAPAESYRDDGNRWLFQNANGGWGLPPQAPCAEIVTGGPIVDVLWRRLLDRAGPRPLVPLTDDPYLYLMADGNRIDATTRTRDVYVFNLLRTPNATSIVSRAAVPQELGLARDSRCLGVALRQIVIRRGSKFRVIEADNALLTAGFHAFEKDKAFRWTDGNAILSGQLFAGLSGPIEVVLRLGGTMRYVEDGVAQRAA